MNQICLHKRLSFIGVLSLIRFNARRMARNVTRCEKMEMAALGSIDSILFSFVSNRIYTSSHRQIVILSWVYNA
jgi:hypothetical protein